MAIARKRSKWRVWRDVIYSLIVREVKTGFGDKLGLSWAVINPIAFIFVLSFVRGRLDGGETYSMPTFVFMAYGLLIFQLFLQTFNACTSSIKRSKPLFAFRQVQPISPVIASGIFEGIVKVVVMAGIALVMYFLTMEIRIDNPLGVIASFINVWLIGIFMGLTFGIAQLYIPELNKFRNMMTRPLFFISGIFFSLRDIPQEYWWLLDWNPLLHATELSRFYSYSSYGKVGVSQIFVFELLLVLVAFSLLFYRATWKGAISR
ncbi:ABC transporter permease [Agaribacter marinus]|uniref:Transport permease protein n=1 Tax=Agaribacter marinus TaxID=1431249 RepID=A0AA37SWC9_9ALTE|nr:ABC transporter permease [Agaribacter marinus]GLR70888.1 transport permease protein [Agaribacter marinus]